MLRAVLFVLWRWSRWVLIVLAVVAFAVPVVTAARLGGLNLADVPVRDVLSSFAAAGVLLMPIAMLCGMTMGTIAWSIDQQLGMVYFLVHPVPRWYSVLLRFTAGGMLLMLPVLALLAGCLIVSLLGTAPEFVHAYPVSLTLRFAASAVVIYCLLFGAAGAFNRTVADDPANIGKALLVLGGMITTLALLAWLDNSIFGGTLERFFTRWFTGNWSPFALFFGRWGLFDV